MKEQTMDLIDGIEQVRMLKKNDFSDDSVALLDTMRQKYPLSMRLLCVAGDVHASLENWAEAQAAYTEALNMKENDLSKADNIRFVRCNLAWVEANLNNSNIAWGIVDQLLHDYPNDPQVANRVIKILKKSGEVSQDKQRWAEALIAFEKIDAIAVISKITGQAKMDTERLIRMKLLEYASVTGEIHSAKEFSNVESCIDAAITLKNSWRLHDAVEVLEQAIELWPERSSRLFYEIGDCRAVMLDWAEAKNAYEAVVSAKTIDRSIEKKALVNLAQVELCLGDQYSAEKWCLRLLDSFGNNVSTHLQVSDIWRNAWHSNCLKTLEGAFAKWPNASEVWSRIGDWHSHMKNWSVAVAAYEKALSTTTHRFSDIGIAFIEANRARGQLCLGHEDKPFQTYRELTAANNDCLPLLTHMASHLFGEKRYQEAASILDGVSLARNNNVNWGPADYEYAVVLKAQLLHKSLHINEALKALERAGCENPHSTVLVFALCKLYAWLRQGKKAMELLYAFLQCHPDNVDAMILFSRIAASSAENVAWGENRWRAFLFGLAKSQSGEVVYNMYDARCRDRIDAVSFNEYRRHILFKSDESKAFYKQHHYIFESAQKKIYPDVPDMDSVKFKNFLGWGGVALSNGAVCQNEYTNDSVNYLDGRRVTTDSPENSEGSIFLFGASYVAGAGSKDNETIASHLQRMVNALPDRPRRVFNYGVYAQYTQNILLQLDCFPASSGDIVVVIIDHRDLLHRCPLETILAIRDLCVKKGLLFYFIILPLILHIEYPSEREVCLLDSYHWLLADQFRCSDILKHHHDMFDHLRQAGCHYHFLTGIFQRPHDLGEVFLDRVHYSPRGNKRIAEAIHTILRQPYTMQSESPVTNDNKFVKVNAIRHLRDTTFDAHGPNPGIRQWISNVRSPRFHDRKSIGAIIVNCNPFTCGHQYIIAEAAKMVDGLYVFVVEEDKSFFPFEDRLKLVREGTEFLGEKVHVQPSGKFIISNFSFPGYFTKEMVVAKSSQDCTLDVCLFGSLIAPALDIGHRFVGEEPLDVTTRDYNEMMLRLLPAMGVKVHVFPRKETEDGPISASVVRRALEKKDFKQVKTLVPSTTYRYLLDKYADSQS